MTTLDLAKVRAACLELMGMTLSELGWAADADGSISDVDPTTSLDDALPLMEKYELDLYSPVKDMTTGWTVGQNAEVRGLAGDTAANDVSAPLAVCLCALRCAGRDLKDFEEAT